ncbi:jg1151 [Pararge aegeria aegeria]|uniref:Jg1151 protein n=1 Tax=Pararge aegeria aegeria TaxID=348720 RepID=A0A8S4QGA9_9NEOP|nr:jg1151 [Pararge aegeria aegeria]
MNCIHSTVIKKISIDKDVPRSRKSTITLVAAPSPPNVKLVVTKKLKRDELRDNMKEIFLNTNATPIRSKAGKGYACCFCADQFPEPSDLKKHTIKDHDERSKANFMNGVPFNDLYVKLDITDLKCACGLKLQSIEDLVKHLEVKHDKFMHTNFVKHVVPFKFNDVLRCAVCMTEFNHFKLLMEHMNVHFRNHVCEVCGAGFVKRKTLTAHCHRHEKGSYPCKVCAKVFNSRVGKMEHERAIHVYGNRRNKCGYCGEKFKDYTKKNDHEVKVHGVKPLVLKCNVCEKVYDNQRSLTVHSKTHVVQWK